MLGRNGGRLCSGVFTKAGRTFPGLAFRLYRYRLCEKVDGQGTGPFLFVIKEGHTDDLTATERIEQPPA